LNQITADSGIPNDSAKIRRTLDNRASIVHSRLSDRGNSNESCARRKARAARDVRQDIEAQNQMTEKYDHVKNSASAFSEKLKNLKAKLHVDFPWYPYDTFGNFWIIEPIITEKTDFLFYPKKKYADIGAADGDLSFFLESLGNDCDIYDNAPTNMNGLHGANRLKEALNSSVNIIECDLDSQFDVEQKYDLIFFFGILYHLKNPFFVLEKLSSVSSYMFLSTRIARHFRADAKNVSHVPAAYLVAPYELNNDPSNFWIFSDAGLKRIIDRTGWDVIGYRTVGDTVDSNPYDDDRDERAFALLKSRRFGQRG